MALFSALALALLLTPAIPAQAAIWGAYPVPGNRTCAPTSHYNGTAYQACLEFNWARTEVRAIAFVSPGAYTNFQANMKLWFGGGGVSIPISCPTMTSNGPRACWSAFTALRRPYVVLDAQFGIAGRWMNPLRVLDMQLSAKHQEKSHWCGPGAVQTAIATMGKSAPAQSVLAEAMDTDRLGFTMPDAIKKGLNPPLGPDDFRYKDYDIASSGLPREVGLNIIVRSLSRGKPVIVLVKPGQLPWSPNANGGLRHYLVVHGYGGYQGGADHLPWVPGTFKVWDPGAGREETLTTDQIFFAAQGSLLDGNMWTVAAG
ncbi:hypothetical protein D5H75_03015 [Bailinhaonella thermotolerans]|uniref:Peptidase C39-like domain-containing protein n=1 Tax=Bailinhaonella thermotolerans TaxID=1070861 RepID=A0A3A4B579_9ACTN|nr:hypothetical protein D5H75_03015 [Bailinhaonella thermotolerans]